MGGLLQDEEGAPRGHGRIWGGLESRQWPAWRHSEAGKQSTHLERQQGLQRHRVHGVTPRDRCLQGTVWTLDFTLRTGKGATQAKVWGVVWEGLRCPKAGRAGRRLGAHGQS